ncbi:cation-translocating P-type ATPase [Dichotomicrobium thermohalophilum]|uniref:Ca2+-transporting ATPase n=1 Tax=Dichotomicrobium thermohalophilum TaxID=933063 RepID=A0A397Q5N3_9HYPH|nr:cation-transporting P-type ATPase [Dichotomicrobium thermohalophilum]RIA55759.1 Ca2+-transporting ATPase [Dichotomicrobium thermohalophilum]
MLSDPSELPDDPPGGVPRLRVVNAGAAGRLRLNVAGTKRAPSAAERVEAVLAGLPDMRMVRANSRTGNVLLCFDPSIPHQVMMKRAADALDANPGATAKPLSAAPAAASSEIGGCRTSDWHTRAAADILDELGTRADTGLDAEEAAAGIRQHGRNIIPEAPPNSSLTLIIRQFNSLPVWMLLGASAASIVTGGLLDAVVTIAVVSANAGIGYVTESGSERTIRRMTQRRRYTVPVLRGGHEIEVDSAQVVPGDILVLKPDTIIAADARLIEAQSLMVNESLLTGESEPVQKEADTKCPARTPLSNRVNMIYQGAFIASGTGKAVVVATGRNTEIGQIQTAATEVAVPRTRLETDLEQLGTQLSAVSLGICGATFLAGYLRGRPTARMLKSALALAVASIPEGLPTTATTTLALGLRELRHKKILVRRLSAVEAMGSVQAVCFDKTGTLTENQMRLHSVHLGGEAEPREFDGSVTPERHDPVLARLLEIATLCSEVTVEHDAGERRLAGSATETALVAAAEQFGHELETLRKRWPLEEMLHRDPARRYMVTRHGSEDGQHAAIAAKGDPTQILQRSRHAMMADGSIAPLDDAMRRRIRGETDRMAGQGLRVLGFAYAADGAVDALESDLVWVGAAALRDPVRAGVPELISRLQGAGIRPFMITGDHSATARAIAEDIGLSHNQPLKVLDSTEFDSLSPELLAALAPQTHVFARVPPEKKLRLVQALQQNGITVGMTGDGFNDAPALKAADLAIAIGAESASVARDVADIIVDGGEIRAIGDGVEQGRAITSNIRKAVHFMIATNLSEIIVVLAETITGDQSVESPLELLWLNLVSDVFPALGLALEPPERDLMRRPPRPSGEPLLRPRDLHHAFYESLVIGSGALAAHFYGVRRYGPTPHTRTITFMSLVLAQLAHALTCRHDRFEPLGGRALFSNSRLNWALGISLALQAVPFLSGALRRALGISPLKPGDLALAGATAMSTFAINEAMLAYRTRRRLPAAQPPEEEAENA